MPRSKGSEMPQQRQSLRAPLHLKTTSSAESNGVHRPVRDRSPKLEDHRRSPRSPLPEVGVCNQKKRGTRVSDLETRLGHAKEELKKLKEQLASAENAKINAQQELEETKKLIPVTQPCEELGHEELSGGVVEEFINPVYPAEQEVEAPPVQQESPIPVASVDSVVDDGVVAVEDAKEEVIAEVLEEVGERVNEVKVEESNKETSNDRSTEVVAVGAVSDPIECKQEEEPSLEKTSDEILVVEDMPAKEESEIERYIAENAALKKELEEVKAVVGDAKTKEEEMVLKVISLTEKLEVSRVKSGQLEEQLEAVETAKAQLETEMKRLRIQTDQWRKAADTAAAIISADGGMGMDPNSNGGGRRMSERCGSMDKQLGGSMGCETSGNGYVGSPLMGGELDEGMGNGKRKSAGIRMFGELWKKKGHQK